MAFIWLRRLIRRHFNPIPEVSANIWKRRLSLAYMLIAWNAFGFVGYKIYKGQLDWAAYHGYKEQDTRTSAQQWAKTLNIKDAKVYRISGLKVDSYEIHDEDSTSENKSEVPQ